jgi:hypothetical protein
MKRRESYINKIKDWKLKTLLRTQRVTSPMAPPAASPKEQTTVWVNDAEGNRQG